MNGVKVIGLLSLSIPLCVIITRYYLSSEPKHNKLKKKAEEEEEEKEIKSSSCIWSELDSNLLGEILGRLCLTDQARFRAVCKNWLAAPSIAINNSSLLPWWVNFNRKTYVFKIFDTSSSFPNRVASVQNISLTKLGIPSPCSHYRNIRASVIQDWFFFIFVAKRRFFSPTTRTYYFFLFSPRTKKIITLPQFHQSTPFSSFFTQSDDDSFHFRPTFSTRPDSPDCVFFLLDTKNASGDFVLLTYRNGDKEWTARQFEPVPDFKRATCCPVYLGGILYIVSPFGQLASFNYCNGEFKYDNLILDDLCVQNVFSTRPYRMFTLNGELMIMFFGPVAKANVNLPGKPCIRRYDWSSNGWIPVSTLGDNALFVGKRIVGVCKTCTKDRTNNGILSNKIYQVFDGGCLIYSIQDGDLVEYKSITSNLLEDGGGGGVLPEYKYTRIKFSDKISSTYWLEPPCVRSSNNQAQGFHPIMDQACFFNLH